MLKTIRFNCEKKDYLVFSLLVDGVECGGVVDEEANIFDLVLSLPPHYLLDKQIKRSGLPLHCFFNEQMKGQGQAINPLQQTYKSVIEPTFPLFNQQIHVSDFKLLNLINWS